MAVYWIIMIIEFMLHTLATNGQCTSSTNIVPVCTNSTDSYKQMNIPVNGGMADGCQCDVTLVTTPSSGQNIVSVSNVEGVKECGYKVVDYNTINKYNWTCSNNEIVYYSLRLNESFQLTFTSAPTPESNSTGFCLHITTTIKNMDTDTTFTITCRNKYDSATTSTPIPQITIEQSPPRTPTSTPLPPATPQSTTTNPKPALQTITDPKTTSNKVQTSVSAVAPNGRSTDRTPTSSMTSAYGPTEEATRTSNNVLPSVTGIAVGVSFGFLVLIIIIVILICIIRRKDKTRDEYVSRCACRRSDVNHPDNMYDVMTQREDNHHYEMSPARDSNATADAVHPTYDVMVNRSPENSYQTMAPPVNNGVYVNQ